MNAPSPGVRTNGGAPPVRFFLAQVLVPVIQEITTAAENFPALSSQDFSTKRKTVAEAVAQILRRPQIRRLVLDLIEHQDQPRNGSSDVLPAADGDTHTANGDVVDRGTMDPVTRRGRGTCCISVL